MAENNIEIEIKLPLPDEAIAGLREKLDRQAVLVKTSRQVDEYYNLSHRDFMAPQYPVEWLSIRQRGDKTILNYKHWYPENTEVVTYCHEYETAVHDAASIKLIFAALDIRPLVIVDKQRTIYNLNDEYEIVIDDVKDLGYFMEIEALKNSADPNITRAKLLALAESLGCDPTKLDLRGYPYLLLVKAGKR